MGSAFPAEPREWFENLNEPVVMFVIYDPTFVLHKSYPECAREDSHAAADCALLK